LWNCIQSRSSLNLLIFSVSILIPLIALDRLHNTSRFSQWCYSNLPPIKTP